MQHRISGAFTTRRAAELAVERLVQEHGLDRNSISIKPRGNANSAGTRTAGADAESSHPGVEKSGHPELNGVIGVFVACTGADARTIEAAMKDAGASEISGR